MTTKRDGPRVALAQIEDLMKSAPQRGDALRGDGLGGLAAVKRAKVIQTRRERARVAVRHGETSAAVARLDRQLAAEHRLLVDARAEADRVATPVPERSSAWQVHGYVRSQDGFARARYGVSLVKDQAGREALAETTTDKRGYFRIAIHLAMDQIKGESDDDLIALQYVAALRLAAYLAVAVPGQAEPTVDDRPLYPANGAIAYRDLTVANPKDSGKVCQLRTRLLGNSGTRELHDLANEKPGCQIARIRPDHRFYFTSTDQAEALRYDYCAHCFGKARSKR